MDSSLVPIMTTPFFSPCYSGLQAASLNIYLTILLTFFCLDLCIFCWPSLKIPSLLSRILLWFCCHNWVCPVCLKILNQSIFSFPHKSCQQNKILVSLPSIATSNWLPRERELRLDINMYKGAHCSCFSPCTISPHPPRPMTAAMTLESPVLNQLFDWLVFHKLLPEPYDQLYLKIYIVQYTYMSNPTCNVPVIAYRIVIRLSFVLFVSVCKESRNVLLRCENGLELVLQSITR